MPGQIKKQLFACIETGDLEGFIEVLGERKPDNYVTKYGDSLLCSAVEHGQLDIVKLLLSKGADINWQGYEGNNPMMYALDIENKTTRQTVIAELMEYEPNLTVENDDGYSVLDKIFRNGAYQNLQGMIEKIKPEKEFFETCVLDRRSLGKEILMSGHLDLIKTSIKHHNANISPREAHEYAHSYIRSKKTEAFLYLIENHKSFQALSDEHIDDLCFCAIQNGSMKVFDHLLPLIKDINAQNSEERTLSMMAAHNKQNDMLSRLLEAGCDVNIKANNGWTALHFAAYKNNENAVSQLLDAGALVDIKDKKERNPRQIALDEDANDVANLLKNAVANVWRKENDDEIVFFEEKPAAGLSIRDIFNFKTQERLKVVQDIENGHISHETISFNQVGDAQITEAFNELKKQGGLKNIDNPHVSKAKKTNNLTFAKIEKGRG